MKQQLQIVPTRQFSQQNPQQLQQTFTQQNYPAPHVYGAPHSVTQQRPNNSLQMNTVQESNKYGQQQVYQLSSRQSTIAQQNQYYQGFAAEVMKANMMQTHSDINSHPQIKSNFSLPTNKKLISKIVN